MYCNGPNGPWQRRRTHGMTVSFLNGITSLVWSDLSVFFGPLLGVARRTSMKLVGISERWARWRMLQWLLYYFEELSGLSGCQNHNNQIYTRHTMSADCVVSSVSCVVGQWIFVFYHDYAIYVSTVHCQLLDFQWCVSAVHKFEKNVSVCTLQPYIVVSKMKRFQLEWSINHRCRAICGWIQMWLIIYYTTVMSQCMFLFRKIARFSFRRIWK